MNKPPDAIPVLVPDGIENPKNARALLDAATMFGCPVTFRDTAGLSRRWDEEAGGGPLPTVTTQQLLEGDRQIVALENEVGSGSIFGAPPLGRAGSLAVGNERRGVGRDLLAAAERVIHIPSVRSPETLNVAAAAAVGLYYLCGRRVGESRMVRDPERHRPSLLLMAPSDHVEAGSVLRSAASFGWKLAAIDDREHVWFGTARAERTEGRAAARSHRSILRVVPVKPGDTRARRVVVVTTANDGPLLRRSDLAMGPGSLLVIPDEETVDVQAEDWSRLGERIGFARLDIPERRFAYRYRLTATIVLAEAARQIGTSAKRRYPTGPRGLEYRSVIRSAAPTEGEDITWEELSIY